MISSDHAFLEPRHERPSGASRRHFAISVRRSLRRAGAPAHAASPRPTASAAASCCSRARPARARAGWSREFAAEAAEDGALVLYGACDAVVPTPYGPFAEALDQLARGARSRRAAGRARCRRRRADPPAPRPGRSRRRAPAGGRGRLRHRAPPAPHGGRRPARRRLRPPHDAPRDRGRPLGRRRDAPAAAPPRARRRADACCCSRRSATPRPTSRAALAETLADLRRYDVVRLRLAGLSGEDVADFVRRAGAGELGAEPRGAAPRPSARSRRATRSSSASCGAPLVETGRGRARRTGRSASPLARASSAAPRASARSSASGSRGWRPARRDLLELAATVGTEFELDVVRRAAGLGEPELLARARRGVPQRHDRGDARAAGWPGASPTSWCGGRSTTGCRGPRRAELHLRVGEALEAGRRALGPGARRPRAPLRRRRAVRGSATAPSSTTCCAARAAGAALAFDEAAARLRTALELGIDDPASARRCCSSSGRPATAAARRPTRSRRSRRRRRSPASWATRELLARAAIGYEDACWRPSIADRGAVELLEEADAALGTRTTPSCASGCSAGSRARSTSSGDRERGAVVRASAIAMARRLDDRAGLATVLMRSYWSRGTTSLEEILDMLTEAKRPRRGAGRRRDPDRGDGVAGAGAGRPLRPRRRPGRRSPALRETAERTAQPFMLHVAEHYGSALALCDGRLEEAETLAAALARVGPAARPGATPSGIYGIQMFSVRREQGRLAELAPVMRILAGDPRRDGPWRPGLVALLAELGMEAEAQARARAARGRRARPVPRIALARLARLSDRRLRRARRRGRRRARLPRARAARRAAT